MQGPRSASQVPDSRRRSEVPHTPPKKRINDLTSGAITHADADAMPPAYGVDDRRPRTCLDASPFAVSRLSRVQNGATEVSPRPRTVCFGELSYGVRDPGRLTGRDFLQYSSSVVLCSRYRYRCDKRPLLRPWQRDPAKWTRSIDDRRPEEAREARGGKRERRCKKA